ncbi:MAG: hypothetical protein ABEJ65_07375, partial [bacterium]
MKNFLPIILVVFFTVLTACGQGQVEDSEQSTNETKSSGQTSKQRKSNTKAIPKSKIKYEYEGNNAPDWYGKKTSDRKENRASGYGTSSRLGIAVDKAQQRAKLNLAIHKGMAVRNPDGSISINGTLKGVQTTNKSI